MTVCPESDIFAVHTCLVFVLYDEFYRFKTLQSFQRHFSDYLGSQNRQLLSKCRRQAQHVCSDGTGKRQL